MRLLTQAYILDRYGPRMDMEQLSELLDIKITTLHNKRSAGTLGIKTYLDGGKRYADYQEVAQYLDDIKLTAA